MDLACCHGNRYDVISALKVLPNNRVAKIFIVCLHYEISFFGIFHRFTNTIATKKTLSSLLKRQLLLKLSRCVRGPVLSFKAGVLNMNKTSLPLLPSHVLLCSQT